ncbi:MAG: hypothetical protein HY474_00860 [Candidatus Sungbacteria bacterium]|uniref:Uncharacterized protein n=1 Tax=Candidatus Sungiibacteriota bacterium TaxID=2750080 RepID=A0A933DT00_9BACT|nr:hypothetical protein [Candidatus Sungbacteria bacterium]
MPALTNAFRRKIFTAAAGAFLTVSIFLPLASARAAVPTLEVPGPLVTSSGITATQTTQLRAQQVFDQIATRLLKIVIRTLKDMIIRWIITGRFEGPVFSLSYTADVRKSIENASRAILEELTGIPFCSGISVPSRAFFSFGEDLTLACSFPNLDRFRLGEVFEPYMLTQSVKTENSIEDVWVAVLDQQRQASAVAAKAYTEEYRAGQGFLNIKDPRTGKTKTPGRTVAEQVNVSQILGPEIGARVADDVQTAIAEIIDTAIRVIIERGLGSGSSR